MTDTAQTPHNDFDTLLDGYRRFRTSGWEPERARWAELREGQQPRVMIIACSDSRVDPAQIFDTSPGEVFVVRNVAALVPPFETTLIKPADAFLPNSVPWGPRRTSRRSISTRSAKA